MRTPKLLQFYEEKIYPFYTDIIMAIFGLALLAYVFHYFQTALVYPGSPLEFFIVVLAGLFHAVAGTMILAILGTFLIYFSLLCAKVLDWLRV